MAGLAVPSSASPALSSEAVLGRNALWDGSHLSLVKTEVRISTVTRLVTIQCPISSLVEFHLGKVAVVGSIPTLGSLQFNLGSSNGRTQSSDGCDRSSNL